MRLYCQPGLSSRVVQALRTRLERTLRMAAEEGRARSRSRGREADESETPGMPEGTPGMPEGNSGMPQGVPGDMTAAPPPAPSGMEVLELTQKISECATRIGNVTEDLAITLDHFNHGRVELQKGFQELSTQIKSTAHCITTMTSGVSFQAGETTKLLKAFDRWAATGRWALAGNQPVEANIRGVQSEIEKQTERLETNLSYGFESIGKHLQEMVRLLEERTQSTALPSAVGGSGTPITPGGIGTSGIAIPPMAGSLGGSANPGHAMGGEGIPHIPGTASAPGTTGPAPAPAVPPLPPAVPPRAAEPVSLFMAFCPKQPNGQRPNAPLPIPTPCQRVGIVTRDAGTGVQRTLSPTAYRPEQTSGITSHWAPQGLGMIRDGNSQFRRIY